MKLSQYNLMVEVEADQSVLYNTFTRDYFLLDESQKKMFQELFDNFHKASYSSEEADFIMKLTQKKFIVHDDLDEIEKIKNKEDARKTQQQTHVIVFKTTLDCNFKCTYCKQYHDPISMSDEIEANIVEYVNNESKKYKNIQLVWFGGEPLLEISRMKSMSQKLIDVCSANDCDYSAAITTNGYLLTDEVLSHFEAMRIKRAQITLDGVEKYHNMTRPYKNGEGTFNVIYKNILKLLALDIALTLRVNVNKENYSEINSLLEFIPVVFRNKIRLSMANWFQTTPKLSLYSVYDEALEQGYHYSGISNNFGVCERTFDNSISILPNGEIVICSEEYKLDKSYGRVENGKIIYNDSNTFIRAENRPSITENERCRKCIELPMCMGGCVKERVNNIDYCAKFVPDGLSVEEKVKLHIKHDWYYNPEVIRTL